MSATLQQEKQLFLENRKEDALQAAQSFALQMSCGIDLQQALNAPAEKRANIAAKLSRLIKRERLKGLNKHWSYDLNRHIALKQAQTRLLQLL
ncbi:cytoplasmic protein [Ochrobactrum sp. SFR4]|uniref:cytoplasmic protein n=1 Tax=Ochrobactrum sp. SFR4 TaxID=2717368 RepID=UPI001C8CA956|nr:cytoplasmic protein [Ochrobactrum sp. SFR4]MBX8824536.1 cytoplasmic protein [Ochrobactrum sp. SFR4]